jgi:ribulose-phosphate 3-epimerase
MKQKIWPSIMAKNQQELNQDFKRLEGFNLLHLDITDGKFAPSKVMDFNFKLSKKFNYNVHLMMKNPLPWIKKNFQRIEMFIPHFEEIKDVPKYIKWMKKNNRKVAFALLPETNPNVLKNYVNDIDYILILTVHPGFYGGKFLSSKIKKINKVKELNPKIKVIVDGGVNPEIIFKLKDADYFVSGSYTVKSDNPKRAVRCLLKNLKK